MYGRDQQRMLPALPSIEADEPSPRAHPKSRAHDELIQAVSRASATMDTADRVALTVGGRVSCTHS